MYSVTENLNEKSASKCYRRLRCRILEAIEDFFRRVLLRSKTRGNSYCIGKYMVSAHSALCLMIYIDMDIRFVRYCTIVCSQGKVFK